MAIRPLNPALYYRLRELFGRVVIGRQGEAASIDNLHGKRRITYGGEAYRINCPLCARDGDADTRQRMWIGHWWGVWRPETQSENLGQAVCFHNDCTNKDRGWEGLLDMKKRVYTDRLLHQGQQAAILIKPGEPVKPLPEEIDYPGECIPLTELASTHPAVQYLVGRYFDLEYLTREYGVRYCHRPPNEYSYCLGRLIIPIYLNGKMRTWQARYIGTPPKGISKYMNQRGASTHSLLYGHDAALAAPFVTLTEGPTNVWRLGSGAVASLGKHVSLQQFHALCQWRAAVIALDPDAYFQSEDVFQKLSKKIPTVKLMLPKGSDPDSLGVDAFWALVVQASYEQGVVLPV